MLRLPIGLARAVMVVLAVVLFWTQHIQLIQCCFKLSLLLIIVQIYFNWQYINFPPVGSALPMMVISMWSPCDNHNPWDFSSYFFPCPVEEWETGWVGTWQPSKVSLPHSSSTKSTALIFNYNIIVSLNITPFPTWTYEWSSSCKQIVC